MTLFRVGLIELIRFTILGDSNLMLHPTRTLFRDYFFGALLLLLMVIVPIITVDYYSVIFIQTIHFIRHLLPLFIIST